MKLTKRSIEALRARESDYFVFDDAVRGFGVRVHPTGRKIYLLKYRSIGDRKTKRLVIGAFGDLSVEDARDLARQHRGDVSRGADPARARRDTKAKPTVEELGSMYLDYVRDHRKPKTVGGYVWQWNRHILPALGSQRVVDVAAADISRLHRKLKDTPYQANRVIALVGAFFTFAIRQGERMRGDNPAHEVTPFKERSRERFLTPVEFARLGAALTKAQSEGLRPAPNMRRQGATKENQKHRTTKWDQVLPADPFAVACVRLLALTGMRRGEALSLRWSAVDLERGQINLADSKTGKSTRPLGAAARSLLKSLDRIESSPWVFPGRNGAHLGSIKRLWHAVRHEAKLEDVRIHDLRHSAASALAVGGESLLVIGALLGHKDFTTTSKYSHLGNDPLSAAADRVAGDISAWMSGAETTVTPLRKAR